MYILALKIVFMFGLRKAILKVSIAAGIASSFLGGLWSSMPKVVFGVTISLWITYILTVTLDWFSGLKASRFEARKNKKEFVFDKDKTNTNWYKHALFIIIISTIYYLQKECIRLEMSKYISDALVGIQIGYFTYNMITEWISIERNRFRVTGKYSRLSIILSKTLDVADKIALKKFEDITNTKSDEKDK